MRHRGERLAGWLRQRVASTGTRGLVVGLSGGIDSAVVARLCQMASPTAVLAAMLPCHSDPKDEEHAWLVAEHFTIPTTRIDLGPAYDALLANAQAALDAILLTHPPAVALDDIRARLPVVNVKPRLRMSALYFLANSLNYLVAGTGNRSELMIGYFTKYGDGAVDLLPIGHLLKHEVTALARELEVPPAIIDKPPSAGLWIGQVDEEEMGFSYADLERYLTEGPDMVRPATALKIERLRRATSHKREVPALPDE